MTHETSPLINSTNCLKSSDLMLTRTPSQSNSDHETFYQVTHIEFDFDEVDLSEEVMDCITYEAKETLGFTN